ncbi:iron-containing alcohol dehydrogenase [Pelosinus fermentans]|uniref:iron-containing alcohol dehydrogenase n=1 Tax=Pelosinus fermentans TaxID=365349 RepID=UPI0002684F3F|nr:iron-containing alcohol dehydrogenase [Pelosinus fermentans]EIW21720.1 iron-containing alcohol dehydrogenase [Pelosinus fermentans A11]
MHFTYYMPTKIFFGCGEFEKAPAYIKTLGNKVLIVTGKYAMKKYGFTKRLVDDLAGLGIESMVFEGISANPLASEVNACVEKFSSWQPEVVVALGGGSAIDAGKGILLGLSTGEKVEPYLLGHLPITHVDIPLVAIPTTAGTGSETNWAAILTDESTGTKTSFRHKGFFPAIAIVDPQLTMSLSPETTVETGFDVFAHGVETYISKSGLSPLVGSNSLKAIQLVGQYLPQVLVDGQNSTARTYMMYASMLMGFNLANSSTCLPHRLQYPIGVKTNSSHGSGLMALFESWLDLTYEISKEKFNHIAEALHGTRCSNKREFMNVYRQFRQSININPSLADFSLTKADVSYLASKVTGNLSNDPAGEIPGIVEKIYDGAFSK